MKYDESNPFARILRGELPCIKVAETDATLAFMDLMPQSDGHVLVVPKEAAAEIFELSDAATVACMRMTQKIAVALRAALQPDGMFIGQFNWCGSGPDSRACALSRDPALGRSGAAHACARNGPAGDARSPRATHPCAAWRRGGAPLMTVTYVERLQ
jgi:hypothetical protein